MELPGAISSTLLILTLESRIMDLYALAPWFNPISDGVNHDQLRILHTKFIDDFVKNPFTVEGKKIRIIERAAKVTEYSQYCETFFHLITRKSEIANARLYTSERANRIHWIKPILLSHPSNQVKYFKWRDDKGLCKEHYWFFQGDFIVVTRDLAPDVRIVTAFCVDEDSKPTYWERFADYRDKRFDC